MKTWLSILTLLVAGVSPTWAADDVIETYTIERKVDGESIVHLVQIYPDNLLENPGLLEHVDKIGLDHIVYLTEESETISADEEKVIRQAKNSGVPVEEARERRGFWSHIVKLWNEPEADKSGSALAKSIKKSIRVATVSTVTRLGALTIMYFFDPLLTGTQWLRMALMQGSGSFFLARYPNNYGNVLDKSWVPTNARTSVGANPVTIFARRLSWSCIFTFFYKFSEAGFDITDPAVLSTFGVNALIYGLADAWLSYLTMKKYWRPGLTSAESINRVVSVGFLVGGVGGFLAAADLQKVHWLPSITEIGVYDFRVSTVIMLGYFGTFITWMYKNPESLYNVVQSVQDYVVHVAVAGGKKVESWLLPKLMCKSILRGLPGPPQKLRRK